MQAWGSLYATHVVRSHQSTHHMQTVLKRSSWKLFHRDHQHGTWFVQSLVEVFMAHSHDTELVDLLRMTSERLSHFTNEQGEKQTCNVEMRLSQSLGNYAMTSYFYLQTSLQENILQPWTGWTSRSSFGHKRAEYGAVKPEAIESRNLWDTFRSQLVHD